MKSIRIILIWTLISATVVYSQDRKSFFFIQVTDPQFGMIESNKGFSGETVLYEKAVSEINRLQPAFVVLTGDLVNDKDREDQIAEFKRVTEMIDDDIPVWYSPGNHDIGQDPSKEDIDRFIANYGHDRFAFRHKKSLFIGLNSCIIKSNTPVMVQEQYAWLEKQLRKGRKADNIMIFTHYPFFIHSPDEKDEYFNIPAEARNRYLDLFSGYGVDALVAGHLHTNANGKAGDIEVITTSAVGKPLSDIPSGIRIFHVYPDRIEERYVPVNE